MCEPQKTTVTDVVGEVLSMAMDAGAWVARTTTRLMCRRADDERLGHARRVLCWRFLLEALLAAVTVYFLGRAAMWAFLGAAAVSWTLGYLIHAELRRREAEAELEPEIEVELDERGRPRLEAVS
jgi:hypothetical protein